MLSLLVAAMALSGANPNLEKLVTRVQATYENKADVSAAFEQTYVDSLRGTARVETGRLWAKRDGRVRWTYFKPVRKDFVYTGVVAYFYEPDSAQVTVFEHFEESQLSEALRFLWGQGDLRVSFDIQPCAAECKRAQAGQTVLVLWPKRPLPTVDKILLVVDEANAKVLRSVVLDPLGNETRYALSDYETVVSLDPKLFEFVVPDGVSILQAPSAKK